MDTTNQPQRRDVPGPLAPADLAAASGGRASPVLMLKCATGEHLASQREPIALAADDLSRVSGGSGSTCYRVTSSDYSGSGFDRGH